MPTTRALGTHARNRQPNPGPAADIDGGGELSVPERREGEFAVEQAVPVTMLHVQAVGFDLVVGEAVDLLLVAVKAVLVGRGAVVVRCEVLCHG
jgi:hypothetical protein